MKCTITRMKISGSLERNSAIDLESSMHVAGCESCRNFLSGNTRVAGKIGKIKNEMERVTPQLHQRVMDAVSREAGSNAGRVVSFPAYMIRSIIPIAAAASLAVALMVFVWNRAGSGSRGIDAAAIPEYITSYDKTLAAVAEGITPAVTSSYDKEFDNIKNDLAAAGNFFSGCYSYSEVLK